MRAPFFFCCRKNVVGTLIKWKHTPRSLGGWRSLIFKTLFFLSPSLRCLRLRQQRRLFPDPLRRLFLMGPSNCASVSSTKSQIRTSSMLRIIKTRLEFMIFESYLVKLAFSLFFSKAYKRLWCCHQYGVEFSKIWIFVMWLHSKPPAELTTVAVLIKFSRRWSSNWEREQTQDTQSNQVSGLGCEEPSGCL